MSSSSQAARGSPSRGWPTLPGLISHSPSWRSTSSSWWRVVAGGRLSRQPRERQRHVGVPDEAHPVCLRVEAQLGLQGREHVLPDRVAGAGVKQAHLLLDVHRLQLTAGSARVSVVIVARVHCAASAAPRENSPSGEIAADAQVVVAGQADRGVAAGQVDARVGLGAVADEVAQAPHLLAFGGLDRVQHGLEGVAVAVDIGDDGYSHVVLT